MSVQSVMPAPVSTILSLVTDSDDSGEVGPMEWREVYATVTDPRDRRGRRHSLASVLMLVQSAIVSGATTFAAIRHWITNASQDALADCDVRQDRAGRYRAPHPTTVIRLLSSVNAGEVDLACARHRAAQLTGAGTGAGDLPGLAVDGKSSRGTAHAGSNALHRLGAFLHQDAIMVATCDVDGKTNEINAFAALLDQIDELSGLTITGDAMHCQRKHAIYLHARGAHYVFPVAGNQPGLFDQLDALDWKDVPVSSEQGWMTYDRGHGRQEIRTIQVMPAPKAVRFPHVRQAFLIERHVYTLAGKHLSSIAVLGITDLTAAQARPRDLLALNRGQWSIENRDHYVRDVTLGEDRCRVRAASTPSILATMRSYGIGALRLLGFTNIAEGTRWARDTFTNATTALRLTM